MIKKNYVVVSDSNINFRSDSSECSSIGQRIKRRYQGI